MGRHRSHIGATLTGRPWNVMVVGEDVELSRRLAKALAHSDFRFTFACSGDLTQLGGWRCGLVRCDLVLLQVGRERADGPALQNIVGANCRCIAILPNDADGAERARWLDRGADDCLSLPCDRDELSARLRASLRRRPGTARDRGTLEIGALVLSPQERRAELNGQPLALTTCQFSLLAALAERPGQVIGRERLMEIVRGSAETAFERSIDVQVSRLRAKLHDDSRRPQMLKTVRGQGYLLVASRCLFRNVSSPKVFPGK
jgi:DNA-binding response OmpR family regulator